MYIKILLVFILFSPGLSMAQTVLTAEEIAEVLSVKIRFASHMAYNPVIIRAVEAQNSQQIPLTEIKKRDEIWKNAEGSSNALIREITKNEVARYFQRRVDNNSAIDEVFLTDNQGANVAAYPPTSDYWQGDEDKWSLSFNDGNGKVFIGPLELDASTNKTQVQISSPIVSNQQTIGVLILGVSVDYISAQQ
jgi:hypothetical protein